MSQTATSVSPATLRKVISAASIGNFVEWFDFALYGFLATLPRRTSSQWRRHRRLLKTFAVFAVAFAFGHWAASSSACWVTASAASAPWP